VKLSVRDIGCGMDKATQARIFEPFFTTKEQGEGTGLGLATVYGIIKQSGGTILVESELGKGSTFSIYLPRVQGEAKSLVQARVSSDSPRGSELILLVEDEEGVRNLICHVLRQQGYTVLDAPDGTKAQEICARYPGPIHLLLTDLVMPGTNGRDMAERLASARPAMKILYMSGYVDNVLGQQGEVPSGTAFLSKPFTPDSLARKVREVLDA
jgi:CheY-like chemotaxis protein